MNKINNTRDKEEHNMATLADFRQSTIIKRSKTKDFLKAFNDNRTDKKYWDECKKTNRTINASAMETLKKICLGKENE